jgi:hypothetical protein
VVYWCNSYTIVHFSLDIIEWFKYKLEKVFKIVLDTDSPPSQYQQSHPLNPNNYPVYITDQDLENCILSIDDDLEECTEKECTEKDCTEKEKIEKPNKDVYNTGF